MPRSPRATGCPLFRRFSSSKAEKSSISWSAFTPSLKSRSGWMLSSSAKYRRRKPFLFIGLVLGIFASCSSSRHHGPVPAPTFELKDLSGNAVRLKSYEGHPVLLDFWATWCGPCRMSIPMVQDFYARHQRDGMVVLGLNIDDDPSGVYGFVKEFKMTYPVLLAANSSVPSDY